MSVITLFTKTAPTLNGIEFDAVLQDSLELEVQFTGYPIEVGARAVDHGIVQPMRYTIVGAVSNNPVRPTLGGIAAGTLANFTDSGLLGGLAGVSAGLLSGSDETRASNALELLIELAKTREPFDVDAVDIQLKNMVIASLSRSRDPGNENALIFTAELQELATLDTVTALGILPRQGQLPDNDPAKIQAAAQVDGGQIDGVLGAYL